MASAPPSDAQRQTAATPATAAAAAAYRRWVFVSRVLLEESRALGDGRVSPAALEELSALWRHAEQTRTQMMQQLAEVDGLLRLSLGVLDGAATQRSPLARRQRPCQTCPSMDMNLERQHLQIADRHIAEAGPRIATQEQLIASGRLCGQELDEALALLRSMHRALGEFEEHRRAIVRMIDDGPAPGHAQAAGPPTSRSPPSHCASTRSGAERKRHEAPGPGPR